MLWKNYTITISPRDGYQDYFKSFRMRSLSHLEKKTKTFYIFICQFSLIGTKETEFINVQWYKTKSYLTYSKNCHFNDNKNL